MKVNIKRLDSSAVIPKYSKEGDAGLDLTATSYTIENSRHVFGTGLAFEIPKGYVGLIFPRSSICKYDMRLTNCVGVVDSNYRGEVKFFFENDNMFGRGELSDTLYKEVLTGPAETKVIQKANEFLLYKVGDRIGQLIIMPYPKIELQEVDMLSETNRGDQGFGSSGK